MFTRGTKNVNVFVVVEVGKPFSRNIFHSMGRLQKPSNWSHIGTRIRAMKNAEIDAPTPPVCSSYRPEKLLTGSVSLITIGSTSS